MEKVKYERTVTLPLFTAEKLDKLNLQGTDRTRALKFLRLLVKNSKQSNDNDGDIFNYVELPSSYLVKSLGGSYNKVLEKLVNAEIIIKDNYYSTINHKSKRYKLKDDRVDDKYYYSNMFTFFKTPKLVDYVYQERLDPQSRELTTNFRESVEFLKMNLSSLDRLMADYLNSISIDNFNVDYQITQPSICLGDPKNKMSWRKTKDLISKSNDLGKSLIQDKKRFYTMTKEEFLSKKRRDILISHSAIIRKLERGEFFASRNETNNRLDTNFTSMPSYMLKDIMQRNNLVELDLCNSQMAIFTTICDLKTQDFEEFKNLALNCNLYEHIQDKLNLPTRLDAKSVCFSVLFSDYRNKDANLTKFKSLFPTVMDWINDFKKEQGSKNFSITLQKKESEIFIDNLYPRIVNNGIFVLTKHDSLIVKQSDEQKVRDIIEKYFKEIDFNVVIR